MKGKMNVVAVRPDAGRVISDVCFNYHVMGKNQCFFLNKSVQKNSKKKTKIARSAIIFLNIGNYFLNMKTAKRFSSFFLNFF